MEEVFTTSKMMMAQVAGRGWSLTFEGMSLWLALGLWVLVLVVVGWAYARQVSGVSVRRRMMMGMLRGMAALVLLVLLTKPVWWRSVTEKVKEPLLVLVDGTESMEKVDRRDRVEDLRRLAMVLGQLAPEAEVVGEERGVEGLVLPEDGLSRAEVIEALAGNEQMRLWERLAEVVDLQFYVFGEGVDRVVKGEEEGWDAFFGHQSWRVAEGGVTAIGDALMQVLKEPRVRKVKRVLLMTDGGQNGGGSAIEAAQVAREMGVELLVYGVGVTESMEVQVEELEVRELEVRELEKLQAGMNEKLLRGMAEVSGGRFLREEDLYGLPELLAGEVEEVETFKKAELYYSGWFLAVLLGLCFAEWGLRRWSRLK